MADKKIVFLLQDLTHGGAQRHTVGLARALLAEFDPVLMVHGSGISEGMVPSELTGNVRLLNERGLLNPWKWGQIARAVAREKPNCVVAINQVAMILAMIGKILGIIRCPVITIFHSSAVGSRAGWIRTVPYFPAVWLSSAIVYISRNQHKLWTGRFLKSRRVEIIRNGINVGAFGCPDVQERETTRRSLGFNQADLVIGCVAVFRREKNHTQLIDAVAELRNRGIGVKLLLVGDGPKRDEIVARVNERRIAEHVIFAGHQADVRPYIATMDVGAIVSSSIETLSLAALEIMAMGVPIIMSDTGGASEIVVPGLNGYLFPVGDTPALVTCLLRFVERAHVRELGHAASETVQRYFDDRAMYASYAALFRDLTTARMRKQI